MGLFNSLKIVNCLLTDYHIKMNFMHSPIFKAAFSSDVTEECGTDNASAGSLNR